MTAPDRTSSADGLVVVEQVRPEITYVLRQEVLRPGLPADRAPFPNDKDPASAHFAAYPVVAAHPGAGPVGVASLLPEAEPDGPGRWRLRGMAVAEPWRDQGLGRALLARVLDHVARLGGGVVWCNARIAALRFYEREGFVVTGEPWDEPDLGPHVRMRRLPTAAD